MDLFYLLKALLRRKWLIIIPTLVALVAAFVLTRFKPKYYTAISEISTGFTTPDPFGEVNLNVYTSEVKFNNVIQTILSSKIVYQVSYSLLLHDLNSKVPFRAEAKRPDIQKRIDSLSGNSPVEYLQARKDSFVVLTTYSPEDKILQNILETSHYDINSLLATLNISRIPRTDFIEIRSRTNNPQLSAYIANAICGEFLRYYQYNRFEASSTSIDTLEAIMKQKKQILDSKINLLQEATGGNLEGSTNTDLLRTFETQLAQEKQNQIASQVTLDNVNKQIASYSKENKGLSNNEEIIDLRSRIDNLLAQYVNSGSNNKNLLTQIDELREQLKEKSSQVATSTEGISLGDLMRQQSDLQVKINVSQKTIASLQDNINSLKNSVQSSTSKGIIIQSLQNEIDLAKQEYREASNRYNEVLNKNIFPGTNFKQTLRASPPFNADPSKKAVIIGLSGLATLFLSVFLILLFEFADPTVKAPSFFKAQVKLPLLSTLRHVNLKKHPVENIFDPEAKLPHNEIDFKNQVKQLRYELEQSESKTFLVASASQGAGKTLLIESLADSLSLSGKKVLIIDANFQNNELTRKYDATPALEDLKYERDDLIKRDFAAIVKHTGSKNIDVIGCNQGNYTPEEILPVNNLLKGLKITNMGYDYILIESVALHKGPDSKELLKYAERVMVVFSAAQPLTEADKKYADYLMSLNGICMGAVLNNLAPINMNL